MNKRQQQLFDTALAAHEAGDLPQAEASYTALLQELRHPRALSYLSEIRTADEDYETAIQLLDEALSLDPNDSSIWINRANVCLEQGNPKAAKPYYQKAAELDPEDSLSRYQLAVIAGDNKQAEKHRKAYSESLFDGYATSFEDSLVTELGYATPDNFADMLLSQFGPDGAFGYILDAGCGTGLLAETLSHYTDTLTGIDISENMVAEAAEKQLYSTLARADLETYLMTTDHRFDLICVADVLVYFGSLRAFFSAAKRTLTAGGYLLISVEAGGLKPWHSYQVQASGRFAHGKYYVLLLAKLYGFKCVNYRFKRLRNEEDQPLMGHHFLLQR